MIRILLVLSLAGLFVLSGCSGGTTSPSGVPAATASPAAGGASIVAQATAAQVAQQADLIVVGTVSQVTSYWNSEHSLILTDVAFAVDSTLKGTAQAQITVTAVGGTVDGITLATQGSAFAVGQNLLLFLTGSGSQGLSVVGASQGIFTIEDGNVSGTALSPEQFVQSVGISGQSAVVESPIQVQR